MRNANRTIERVKKLISALRTGKNQFRLVLMAGIAIRMLDKSHLLVKFLKDVVYPDVLAKALPSVMKALQSVKGLAVGAMEKVVSAAKGGLVEDTSKQAMSIGVNVGARTCTNTGAKLGERTVKNVGAQFTAKGAKRVGKRAGANATQQVGSKAGTKAVSKTAAKQAGKVIIGVSAAFLVLDAIDLAFTVQDIVENQGSEAARILRCKADEYEALLDA